ncbi:uncharacterized protein LTR77_002778 [Saxophila tyrrhenica]|uniref:Uncharacterized protein n=1 Tax=Saxophila tyrrhenica TaxID=1690608 RepID=A0AAV9PJW0_9PEZI|nr:hypothetical protein LTR77_002778 [Saxophila tyrrhenica]
MAGQEGNNGEELTFVVTTNPFDRSTAANKRRVRSVAALRSWPERRKKTFENVDQTGSQGGFVLDLPESSRPKSAKRKRTIAETTTTTTSTAARELVEPRQDDEEPLFEACTRAKNEWCNCIHCQAERTYLFGRAEAKAKDVAELEPEPSPKHRKTADDGET